MPGVAFTNRDGCRDVLPMAQSMYMELLHLHFMWKCGCVSAAFKSCIRAVAYAHFHENYDGSIANHTELKSLDGLQVIEA